MPAFRTSGTTGAAPTTVWMSYVADKYTMLSPYQDDVSNNVSSTTTSLPACKFTNLFNARHCSFGAFTTAPDGTTNTAQKIVEDNTNNLHYIQAGVLGASSTLPSIRIAKIFKAAERTRVALQVLNNFSLGDSLYVGFDLAGGQIAYGAQFFGSGAATFQFKNQIIQPVGGGFYLCILDFQETAGNTPSYRVLLDNGSGTAAPSVTYPGDGISGLFGWRSSVLPVQAWAISSQVFFDDFNDPTMANIDLNGTLDPTKNWFVQQDFHNTLDTWLINVPIPPGSLSVSGSVLHIPPSPISPGSPNNIGPGVSSFGQSRTRNPSPGVGTGWRPPFMLETKCAVDYPNIVLGGNAVYWGGYVEYGNAVSANDVSRNNSVNGGELDLVEYGFPWVPRTGQFFYGNIIGGQGTNPRMNVQPRSIIGYPPYQSSWSPSGFYQSNITVVSGGNYYASLTSPNFTAPPSADWTAYSYPGTLSGPPPFDPMFIADPGQMHLYTTIVLPYNRVTKDRGCHLHFYDGVLRFVPATWTPNADPAVDNSNLFMHTTDWMRFFVMFMGGTGYGMSVDSFKASQ